MKAPVLKPYFRLARGLVTARRPVYLHFAVTHRCNLRCRMCAAWRLADEDHEVRIQEIRRIAAAFARLGCALVSLGGGEPFLREDLPDVIAAFAVEGIRVRVLTNGVAPDTATLRRAFAAGLADVSISLDSLEPRVQGLIDGDPDSLHRKLDTLAALL
ncbi:radical SAM protein, partial [bacterium]|nr:radical SAM protein [candidate division CSSED10-310 bacterium]